MPLIVFFILFTLSFSLTETWLLTVHFNKNIMSVIMLHYFKFFILLAPKPINLPKTFFFFFFFLPHKLFYLNCLEAKHSTILDFFFFS